MKTLTEKYRGVLNESFSKKQFVRDARMAWPQLITQFSGFEDTVTILKQKGMISEEDKMPEYSEFANLSDDAVRRGIDAELEAMGIDSAESHSAEDHAKAKEKALKNLKKDPLHYLNLMSGESSKVDKHDQMVEPNEKNKVDAFNGMKKADLKEEAGVPTAFDDDSMNNLLNIILKYVKDPNDAEKALQQVDDHGLDSLSPELLANLDRDPEYKAWYNNLHGIKEADPIPTEPGVPGERASNHDRKMAMRKIIDFLTVNGHPDSGHKVSTQDAIDFIKTHKDDIFSGDIDANDIADVWNNYDEYESVNMDNVEELSVDRLGRPKPDAEPSRFQGRDKSRVRTQQDDQANEVLSDDDMKAIEKYGHPDKTVRPYRPGDGWSSDFDYEGMLEFGLKIRLNTPIATLQALYDSFEDVNYHRENSHLGMAIDAIQDGDKGEALDHIRNFKKEIKKTLVSFNEGADPSRKELEEAGAVVTERVGSLDEFISLIQDRAAESGFSEPEEAEEVIEALQDHYNLNEQAPGYIGDKGLEDLRKMGTADINLWHVAKLIDAGILQDSEKIKALKALDPSFKVNEKKGKDHDGDGDVDGDDYMAAKDKAIKKAMGKDEIVKENIKAIIQKVLEEGTINEAATQELARMADSYAGFDGMKAVVMSLQDIVTEIERFYDNTRGKIQKAFNSMGEVRNEEGLKVGGFLAPAVESAFNKDLRPVTKQGFTKGIDQPRVKVLSQAELDAARRGGSMAEAEPKQTVYSPVNEKK